MTGRFEYPLEDAQIEAFDRDGAIHLRSVIDDKRIGRAREACARAAAVETVEGSRGPTYFMRLRLWERDEVFKHFCNAPSITGIAAQLLRSDKLNVLYDQMFSIEPGSGDRTNWHHDLPYWPVTGQQIVTIWLAFDRVTKDNAGLEFVRGSHLWDKQFQPMTIGDDGRTLVPFDSTGDDRFEYVSAPDFDAERHNYDFLSFDLEPGDALAFHPLTVHGSYPNTTTDMPRRAYAMRFTGREIRYYDGPVWNTYIMNPSLKTGDLLDSDQYPIVFDAR